MAFDLATVGQKKHLLNTPVKELSLSEVAEGHCILKEIGGVIEDRLKEFREPLVAQAKTGAKNEKGHLVAELPNATITHQKRTKETIDEAATLKLLVDKKVVHLAADPVLSVKEGVDPNDPRPMELLQELAHYFTLDWKVDEKRVEALVVARVLSADDVKPLLKEEVTWALVVKPKGELKALLKG